MTHPHLINDAAEAMGFITGGKARFTLKSLKSDKRYTYRVAEAKDGDLFFASLLVNGDNESGYEYIGFFKEADLIAGRKGNAAHPAFKALDWAMRMFRNGKSPEELEFWHEGRCAKCARPLTDPASIERGFGPECAKSM